MSSWPSQLKLEVATPKGLALSTEASSIQAPSVLGELGVLPGHTPALSSLQCGILKYVQDGKKRVAAIDRGFLEVEPGKVIILTEAFARPEDIDVEATKTALADAEKRLEGIHEDTTTAKYQEALRDQAWARARLTVAGTASPLH